MRTAIEALAAVLGGTQSLHTNSFDEALALPTEHAVRLALRTQQVIAHETGVVNTIDPLGGSYYLEHLTDELERQAYDYFDRIEKLGGVVDGDQGELLPARDRRGVVPLSVARSRRSSGSSSASTATQLETSRRSRSCKVDPALEQQQIERVRALRGRRDSGAVEAALARLKDVAAGEGEQPDGPDHRRLPRQRHHGRDVRRAPPGLGRLARDTGLLMRALAERWTPWVAAAVLVAGVVAFAVTQLRQSSRRAGAAASCGTARRRPSCKWRMHFSTPQSRASTSIARGPSSRRS